MTPSTLCDVQGSCRRCGAQLAEDAPYCPVCAYGDAEEIVLLEAHRPGPPGPDPAGPSTMPRVLAGVAFLLVVIAVIFAAVR